MTSKNYTFSNKIVHNINNNNSHINNNNNSNNRKNSSNRSSSSRKHQYSDSVDDNILSRMPSPPAYTILRRQQSVSDSEKPTTTSSLLTPSKIKTSHRHHSSASKENRSRSDVSHSHNNIKNNKSSKRHHNRQQESFSSLKTDSSDESDVNSISNTHLKSVSPVISANNNNNIHHLNRLQTGIFPLNSVLEEAANNDNVLRNANKHTRSKSSYDKPNNAQELRRPHSDYQSSSIQESNKLTVTHFSDNDESRSKSSKPYSRRPSFSGSPPSKLDSKKLYAGPTFNNSPDPSELPIPSFLDSKSLTKDSPLSTSTYNNNSSSTIITNDDINNVVTKHSPQILIDSGFSSGNSSDDDMFVMDDIHSNHDISKALKSILKIGGQ
ncbi:7040_t:CDS:2 [Entrophospora sp. SA101]|nr:7040_t:CDS:2 [Entrophospora sp. SA101]